MKTVYPEFSENVEFYVVGISESLEVLDRYAQNNGYPWPVAVSANTRDLRDLGVTQQSYKIAIDKRGVQVYRAAFGSGTDDEWRKVFTQLFEG